MVERPLGMGPMKGKDFDTGNVLGPWIVTRDEIGDPHSLAMEARVNGERWGGGHRDGAVDLVPVGGRGGGGDPQGRANGQGGS